MRFLFATVVFILCLLSRPAGLAAAEGAPVPAAPAKVKSRFTHVDVFIDPKGQPLAAWQIEFAAEVGQISLVGVEAGEHPAFAKKPPYYDPAALAGNRIILADFTLEAAVPNQKTRVARLMLEVRGEAAPQYVTKLVTAANPAGKRIAAEVDVAITATPDTKE